MFGALEGGPAQAPRIAGVLSDAQTARLLRALSLSGPTTVVGLAGRLAMPLAEVLDILTRTQALGVTRCDVGSVPRFEVDAAVLRDLMRQYCDDLLRRAA